MPDCVTSVCAVYQCVLRVQRGALPFGLTVEFYDCLCPVTSTGQPPFSRCLHTGVSVFDFVPARFVFVLLCVSAVSPSFVWGSLLPLRYDQIGQDCGKEKSLQDLNKRFCIGLGCPLLV